MAEKKKETTNVRDTARHVTIYNYDYIQYIIQNIRLHNKDSHS